MRHEQLAWGDLLGHTQPATVARATPQARRDAPHTTERAVVVCTDPRARERLELSATRRVDDACPVRAVLMDRVEPAGTWQVCWQARARTPTLTYGQTLSALVAMEASGEISREHADDDRVSLWRYGATADVDSPQVPIVGIDGGPQMAIGRGITRFDCLHESACSMAFVKRHPDASASHCPLSCRHYVPEPTEARRLRATVSMDSNWEIIPSQKKEQRK